MKGLVNLGNTCYLNAALQCLLHTPPLTNYVLSEWAEKDLRKQRLKACALAGEYMSLTRAYWTAAEPAVLETRPLWAALAKVHKFFGNDDPHDAHEAVLAVLKHLHDALARTPRIRPSAAHDAVDRDAWDAFVARDGYSILTELVVGQAMCVLRGDDGRFSSTTHEHFHGLSLDIEGCATLAQALARSFAPSEIEGFAFPDGRVGAVEQTRVLVYAPLVLVLQLKRFDAGGAKVDRFVDYSTVLEMPGGHGTYDLYAVCLHRDGHYVALCRASTDWHLMDDATVSAVNVNAVVQKDAYVLFYKKRLP